MKTHEKILSRHRQSRLHWLTAMAISLASALPSSAIANPFSSAPPVSIEKLGNLRGGVKLPNGMDVMVGVQIETRVNGELALHTVLNIADPTKAALEIFAPPSQALGSIRVAQRDTGSVVILQGPNLEIQHLTGNATGILVANTLDNRAIDTVATVHVSLADSAVPIGNILLRMESIMIDAVSGTTH